ALRAARAAGAVARDHAPHGRRRRGRGPELRRPPARPGRPRGLARRAADRDDAHRVPAARAVHAQPPPGPAALDHLRTRLGLRLRHAVELARRLCRLPAPQARGGRRAATAAHDTRRRLRPARLMTFTRRLTLAAAAAVAVVAVLGSVLTYVLVRNELRGEVDRSLRASGRAAQRLARVGLPQDLR